jgi:hypothetical protein
MDYPDDRGGERQDMDPKTRSRVLIAMMTGTVLQLYLVMPWLELPDDRGWSLRFYLQITVGFLIAIFTRSMWLQICIGFFSGQVIGHTIHILGHWRAHKFFLLGYLVEPTYGCITAAMAFGTWSLIRRLQRGE